MTVELDQLRALARALASGEPRPPWQLAPLRVPRPARALLVDPEHQRVVPLPEGVTLLAHERRLAAHRFPSKWFEACWVMIEVTSERAAVSDARSTNGARLHGQVLPAPAWAEPVDQIALISGDGDQRLVRLCPAWQPLADGDAIDASFPEARWLFLRVELTPST